MKVLEVIGHVIDWGLRNFLRLILVGAIVAVGGWWLVNHSGCAIFKDAIERRPELNDAEYGVKTDSRIYYFENYSWRDNVLCLDGYWTFEGNQWQYVDEVLPLTDAYGRREVFERKSR